MSLKKSIDNECKNCSYDSEAIGTWREQVKNCAGTTCNLYNMRALPSGEKQTGTQSRRAAVDAHCKACIYDINDKEAKGTWRAQVKACTKTECALHSVRPVPIGDIL